MNDRGPMIRGWLCYAGDIEKGGWPNESIHQQRWWWPLGNDSAPGIANYVKW